MCCIFELKIKLNENCPKNSINNVRFFWCGQKSEQDNDPEISRIMLGEFSVEGKMCERGCKSYITNQVNNPNG